MELSKFAKLAGWWGHLMETQLLLGQHHHARPTMVTSANNQQPLAAVEARSLGPDQWRAVLPCVRQQCVLLVQPSSTACQGSIVLGRLDRSKLQALGTSTAAAAL